MMSNVNEGYIVKHGRNDGVSQIKKRPAPPMPVCKPSVNMELLDALKLLRAACVPDECSRIAMDKADRAIARAEGEE